MSLLMNMLNFKKIKIKIQLPAFVYLLTSKSSTAWSVLLNINFRGSETILLLLCILPTPDAATLIQKRFMMEGLVRNNSLTKGPHVVDMNEVKLHL